MHRSSGAGSLWSLLSGLLSAGNFVREYIDWWGGEDVFDLGSSMCVCVSVCLFG